MQNIKTMALGLVVGAVSALSLAALLGAGSAQPGVTPIVGVTAHGNTVVGWGRAGGILYAVATNRNVGAALKAAEAADPKDGAERPAGELMAADDPNRPKSALESEVEKEVARQKASKDLASAEQDMLGAERVTTTICAGQPVPNGWIKVNDFWSPTTCGSPGNITYNVWVIERYSDRPVGAVMTVCANAPTPGGWVEVDRAWRPTMCGHPANITNNVKWIRRLN